LNVVANKQEYLTRLKLAVEHLHGASATWRETVPVHEVFRGQTVWRGRVEVWSHREGKNDEGERFVAVLEIPPVESAETAVQASILADAKTPPS
jgi:hypothetical protein